MKRDPIYVHCVYSIDKTFRSLDAYFRDLKIISEFLAVGDGIPPATDGFPSLRARNTELW